MQFVPYLTFDGACEEAMRFYAELLGAEIQAMMKAEDTPASDPMGPEWAGRVVHAHIAQGDKLLMASDGPPGEPQSIAGVSVYFDVGDPAEGARIFKALSEGGAVTRPYAETFWAHRFGMVEDRFGVSWMISCEKPL